LDISQNESNEGQARLNREMEVQLSNESNSKSIWDTLLWNKLFKNLLNKYKKKSLTFIYQKVFNFLANGRAETRLGA